jgi:hypothetical protein
MHRHDPTRPGAENWPADQFAIPGEDSPTVWITQPPVEVGSLPRQVANLLLNAFTQFGDLVVDLDDDEAFATIAAEMGRRHHALGGDHLASIGRSTGYIDLVLVHWPRPAVNPRWLLRACRTLLSPRGVVVVAASLDRHQRTAHLSALGGAAATAGLVMAAHVTAITPEPHMNRPAAASRDNRPATPPSAGDADGAGSVYPHTDLLIFEAVGGDV